MIKSRLLLLADHLEKIAAKDESDRKRVFNLNCWVRQDSCGTMACAVGEATFIQRFRDLGLRYSKRKMAPTFKGLQDWAAVEKFFGVSHDQATKLFTCTGYLYSNAPELVVTKIRKLVETGLI